MVQMRLASAPVKYHRTMGEIPQWMRELPQFADLNGRIVEIGRPVREMTDMEVINVGELTQCICGKCNGVNTFCGKSGQFIVNRQLQIGMYPIRYGAGGVLCRSDIISWEDITSTSTRQYAYYEMTVTPGQRFRVAFGIATIVVGGVENIVMD